MKKANRVLRVVIGLNQGGVQQGVLNLCRSIDREKYEPIVLAIENGGAIADEIRTLGIRVIVLGHKRKILKTVWAISKVIRQYDIQIVHASSYHPALYSRLAAFLCGFPIIICYEHVIFQKNRPVRAILNRLLDYVTAGYTAVGKGVADQVKRWYGYPGTKVHVIHNGVDTEQFNPTLSRRAAKERVGLDPQRIVVGMVCRLDSEKGHRYFFEAIKMLEGRIDVDYLVVGTGREEELITQIPADLGVRAKITFLGLRRDIPVIMRALDIYVHPTLQEGFPNSLLEAMASETPSIVSNFSGNLELIEDGRNGLVFEMRDAEALAKNIQKLCNDQTLATKLASNGLGDIRRRYTVVRYGVEITNLYDQLLSNRLS